MRWVLVVDDEADFTFFLKKNLEATGKFEVSVCNDSAKAVTEVLRLKPDIVLLDVMMPGMTGEDIANALQEREDTRRIPVVFMTSIVSAEEAEESSHRIGGHLFVAKPVKVEELLRVLDRVRPDRPAA